MSLGLLLRLLNTRASELEGEELDFVVTVCFLLKFLYHWEKLKVHLSPSFSSLLENPSFGLMELLRSLLALVVWRPCNPWAEEHTLIRLLLFMRWESFVFFIACRYLSWTREVFRSFEKGFRPSQGFLLVRGFLSDLVWGLWQLSSEILLIFMWHFLLLSVCLVRISSFTLSKASFLYESRRESTFLLLYLFLSSFRFLRDAVWAKGISLKLDL